MSIYLHLVACYSLDIIASAEGKALYCTGFGGNGAGGTYQSSVSLLLIVSDAEKALLVLYLK